MMLPTPAATPLPYPHAAPAYVAYPSSYTAFAPATAAAPVYAAPPSYPPSYTAPGGAAAHSTAVASQYTALVGCPLYNGGAVATTGNGTAPAYLMAGAAGYGDAGVVTTSYSASSNAAATVASTVAAGGAGEGAGSEYVPAPPQFYPVATTADKPFATAASAPVYAPAPAVTSPAYVATASAGDVNGISTASEAAAPQSHPSSPLYQGVGTSGIPPPHPTAASSTVSPGDGSSVYAATAAFATGAADARGGGAAVAADGRGGGAAVAADGRGGGLDGAPAPPYSSSLIAPPSESASGDGLGYASTSGRGLASYSMGGGGGSDGGYSNHAGGDVGGAASASAGAFIQASFPAWATVGDTMSRGAAGSNITDGNTSYPAQQYQPHQQQELPMLQQQHQQQLPQQVAYQQQQQQQGAYHHQQLMYQQQQQQATQYYYQQQQMQQQLLQQQQQQPLQSSQQQLLPPGSIGPDVYPTGAGSGSVYYGSAAPLSSFQSAPHAVLSQYSKTGRSDADAGATASAAPANPSSSVVVPADISFTVNALASVAAARRSERSRVACAVSIATR